MAQEDAQVESIAAIINNSMMIFKGGAEPMLKILQALLKLGMSGVQLAGKAVVTAASYKSFKAFAARTHGDFSIINFPSQDPDSVKEFLESCRKRGIHLIQMPDLNVEDGMTQFAVANQDIANFNMVYEAYLSQKVKDLSDMNIEKIQQSAVAVDISLTGKTMEEAFGSDLKKLTKHCRAMGVALYDIERINEQKLKVVVEKGQEAQLQTVVEQVLQREKIREVPQIFPTNEEYTIMKTATNNPKIAENIVEQCKKEKGMKVLQMPPDQDRYQRVAVLKTDMENFHAVYAETVKEQIHKENLAVFHLKTHGDYSLLHLPTEDKEMVKGFMETCVKSGIDVMIIDGGHASLTEMAISNKDLGKFQEVYKEFLNKLPSRMNLDQLKNLTGGQYIIRNITFPEGDQAMLGALMERMEKAGIHFCVLPDLKLGDNKIPVAVANADAQVFATVLEAYRNEYMPDLQPEDEDLSQMEYLNSGDVSMDEYIQAADPELRQTIMAPPEKQTQQPVLQSFQETLEREHTPQVRSISTAAYKKMKRSPGYKEITANAKLITDIPGSKDLMIRCPYTKTEFAIEKDRVFLADSGKTYVTFIKPGESLRGAGKEKVAGDFVIQKFNEVKRDMSKSLVKDAKQLLPNLQNKAVKMPKIPKR